jgi:GT2 family glycosyltransferase
LKASVVVLSWNGKNHLTRCIGSVIDQTWKDTEIIIVDNHSTDGSLEELLKKHGSHIQKVIRNMENTGFAKGMNVGIEAATGDFVLLLNQDVFLERAFVANAAALLERNRGVSILGGLEKRWSGDELTDIVVSQGGFFLRKRMQGMTNRTTGNGWCFGVHGSFPCIRREVLEAVKRVFGYCYDPKFETGWEDTDLWFRCQLLGYRAYFARELVAWHIGSASAEGKRRLIDKRPEYQKRVMRNRYYTIIKNIPTRILFRLAPYILITEIGLVPYLMVMSPRSVVALVFAWFETFRHLHQLRRDRRTTLAAKVISDKAVWKFFKAF